MNGARARLRAATAADHDRLDGLFGRFDLGDAGDYGQFLAAHASAIGAVEAALDGAGMTRLLPDWPSRRRGALVLADLAALGVPAVAALPPPAIADDAAAWGAAYVVEGSRLGGALLARQVAAGLPASYLAAPQPKGAWREFLVALDAAIVSEEQYVRATAGACATFDLFEAAVRLQLERGGG